MQQLSVGAAKRKVSYIVFWDLEDFVKNVILVSVDFSEAVIIKLGWDFFQRQKHLRFAIFEP